MYRIKFFWVTLKSLINRQDSTQKTKEIPQGWPPHAYEDVYGVGVGSGTSEGRRG